MTAEQWTECVKTKFDALKIAEDTKTSKIVDLVVEAMHDVADEHKDEVVRAVSRHVYKRVVKSMGGDPDDDAAIDTRLKAMFQEADDKNKEAEEADDEADEADDEATEEADDDEDDPNMPGLLSIDYCEIQGAMYGRDDPETICTMIDDAQDDEVEKDDNGRTLLHWSLIYGSPRSVVQTIINRFNRIEMVADNEGWTPLHYAAKHGSLACVEDIYDLHPEAILEVNDVGIPPVVIARCAGNSAEVVKFLEVETKAEKVRLREKRQRPLSEIIKTEDDDDAAAVTDEEENDTTLKNNVFSFDALLLTFWVLSVLFISAMSANVTAYSMGGSNKN